MQFANQDRWVLGRLDAFESRITQRFSSGKSLDIIEVKFEVSEIKRMVIELYDRSVVSEPVIETVVPQSMLQKFGIL